MPSHSSSDMALSGASGAVPGDEADAAVVGDADGAAAHSPSGPDGALVDDVDGAVAVEVGGGDLDPAHDVGDYGAAVGVDGHHLGDPDGLGPTVAVEVEQDGLGLDDGVGVAVAVEVDDGALDEGPRRPATPSAIECRNRRAPRWRRNGFDWPARFGSMPATLEHRASEMIEIEPGPAQAGRPHASVGASPRSSRPTPGT